MAFAEATIVSGFFKYIFIVILFLGGVVNILTGSHDHMAKYLSEHQDVESVWYFGSTSGSKFVEFASAENVKRTWVNYGQVSDLR